MTAKAKDLTFHSDTPEPVQNILRQYLHSNQRLRLFYGDRETGRDWMEEWDTRGTIGCSMGPRRIPLLIKKSNSYGGGGILDHCILKIQAGLCVIYKHPKYHLPELAIFETNGELREKGHTHGVFAEKDGAWENHANFRSEERAKNFIAFLRGERLIPH